MFEYLSDDQKNYLNNNLIEKGQKFCADYLKLNIHTVNNYKNKVIDREKNKAKIPENVRVFMVENYYKLGPLGCSKELGYSRSRMSRYADLLGLSVDPYYQKYSLWNKFDISKLQDFNNPVVCYYWGFFWADGTLAENSYNIKFKIVKPDFDVIKNIILPICENWRYREDHDGDENHKVQSILEVNHHDLHVWLSDMDFDKKSGASADKILSKIPDHLKHYWWRGYFDGDGSFVFHDRTVRASIVSCFDQDWSFAKYLEEKYNIGYRWGGNVNEERRASTINMEGEVSVKKFMNFILQGDQFGLDRKYQIYYNYLEYKKNVRLDKKSIYKGVTRNKHGYWVMQIYKGKHYRKTYKRDPENEILAAREYDRLAKELFGNKANLNFPNE